MAVGKALDLSNPLIASRISLEKTLDTFSRVFQFTPATAVRRRLKEFAFPKLSEVLPPLGADDISKGPK